MKQKKQEPKPAGLTADRGLLEDLGDYCRKEMRYRLSAARTKFTHDVVETVLMAWLIPVSAILVWCVWRVTDAAVTYLMR